MVGRKDFRRFLMAMLLLALMVLQGCKDEQGPIKIGWIGPLSGASAVLGMDSAEAARIAVEEINAAGGIDGRMLALIIEDDQYDTGKALTAYNKLVGSDDVKVILLNTYSAVFALADRAEQDGVLLLDPLDCNNDITSQNDKVVCLATDSESIGMVIVASAEKRGSKKLGILSFSSDRFMPLVRDVIVREFRGASLKEDYVAGTSDFKTVLQKFQGQNIDGLVLLGYDETGLAMKQARELGIDVPFYTTGTVTSPPLQQAAAGATDGTVFAFWDAESSEMKRRFDEKFVTAKGRPPILALASYPSYDAVFAIANALRQGESLDKEGLSASGAFEGISGTVAFDVDGGYRIQEHAYEIRDSGMARLD